MECWRVRVSADWYEGGGKPPLGQKLPPHLTKKKLIPPHQKWPLPPHQKSIPEAEIPTFFRKKTIPQLCTNFVIFLNWRCSFEG